MSQIIGNGWGSSHNWVGETPQDNSKRTFYECKDCKRFWCHYYDEQPNIFTAMHDKVIPDICQAKNAEVSSE
jgi:hypothetical protein